MINKSPAWWNGWTAAELEYHTNHFNSNPFPSESFSFSEWEEGYEHYWHQKEMMDIMENISQME